MLLVVTVKTNDQMDNVKTICCENSVGQRLLFAFQMVCRVTVTH